MQDVIIVRETVTAETLRDQMAIGIVFERCHFIDCTFAGVDFTDASFLHCDVSNCTFSNSLLYRTAFTNCKMVGTKFVGMTLTATSFVDCLMERAAFEESVWKHVTFQASTLTNSDWYAVKHERLVIERCELTEARFEKTTLNGVDISTSQFSALYVSKDDVEGCIIHNEQAPILLAICGI